MWHRISEQKWWKCAVYKAVFWFRKRIIYKVFGFRHQICNDNKKLKVMFWTNLLKLLKGYFRFFVLPISCKSLLSICWSGKIQVNQKKAYLNLLLYVNITMYRKITIQSFLASPSYSGLPINYIWFRKKKATLTPKLWKNHTKKAPATTKHKKSDCSKKSRTLKRDLGSTYYRRHLKAFTILEDFSCKQRKSLKWRLQSPY